MAKKSAVLIFSLFSSFANACNEYDSGIDSSKNSLMSHLAKETCVPLSDTSLYPAKLLTALFYSYYFIGVISLRVITIA